MSESSIGYALPRRRLAHWPVAISWPVCLLFLVFVLSVPLTNPYVHGDGVGYYAYAQSLLIDQDLRFEDDWLAAHEAFVRARVDSNGRLVPEAYTRTGHLNNHFSVGPTILWAPFLTVTHAAVLTANQLGAQLPARGYSRPYLLTMAVATALYGFLGLLLAFDLTRRFTGDLWAFLATLGIWFASSLPVYMYFNPAWSHAHSAFSVALFLWYWDRTRNERTLKQWIVLALIAGLMMNVYYPNAILMLVPGIEALAGYRRAARRSTGASTPWGAMIRNHACFLAIAFLALLPTLATRYVVFGGPFESGYPPILEWNWTSPVWFSVLFSANHGLLSWTPVLILALVGLYWFWQRDGLLGGGVALSVLAYSYFIASYPDWDGMSSFGNRFFITLTPIFVIGLGFTLERFAHWRGRPGRDVVLAGALLALLSAWNAGFIFQWGTQMIPARGAISWKQVAHNQLFVVPARFAGSLRIYFLRRSSMMKQIEEKDLEWRQVSPAPKL